MKKIVLIGILFNLCITSNLTNAEEVASSDESKKVAETKDTSSIQKIIDDYKTYLASIPPELRVEIINYRKVVADLNVQKREKYNKLSKDAQNYLRKEQEFKKLLPLGQP